MWRHDGLLFASARLKLIFAPCSLELLPFDTRRRFPRAPVLPFWRHSNPCAAPSSLHCPVQQQYLSLSCCPCQQPSFSFSHTTGVKSQVPRVTQPAPDGIGVKNEMRNVYVPGAMLTSKGMDIDSL